MDPTSYVSLKSPVLSFPSVMDLMFVPLRSSYTEILVPHGMVSGDGAFGTSL